MNRPDSFVLQLHFSRDPASGRKQPLTTGSLLAALFGNLAHTNHCIKAYHLDKPMHYSDSEMQITVQEGQLPFCCCLQSTNVCLIFQWRER